MNNSGANCYFSSTALFNTKNIIATDVFNLNKACPVILLDTELSTTDFNFKDWNLVSTGILCVYTVGALGICD